MGNYTRKFEQREMIHRFILSLVLIGRASCYPGALCNVTYSIPASCQDVFSALTQQMLTWDNTTSCPGKCDQRYFLDNQRGPPLSPVTLEGTNENCDKCPCGQKCLYVHKETSENFVRGSHITPVIRYVDDIIFEKLEEKNDYCKLLQHEKSHGRSRIYWFRRVQGRIKHRFMHA